MLKFVLIRLGLFIGVFAVMYALGIDPFFSALNAAMLGLAISLIFFNKQRADVSEAVERWVNRKNARDEDAEDRAAADAAAEDAK